MKFGDPSQTNLHRASTISYGETMPSSELPAGSSSIPCSPGGLKHSHSLHTYLKAGSGNPINSKKENISNKICQNLRRKFSAINKLRVKLQSAGSARPEFEDIDSTVVSDHALVPHTPEGTLPTSELDASYYFPCTTDLPLQQSRLHATRTELAGDSVYELPCMQNPVATEGFENDKLPRRDVPGAFASPLPYSQGSMVSALSSQWTSSGSERQSSWQISQCSGISGITPETLVSETDWVHNGLAYSATDDNSASPNQSLTLDTHLAVPQASIIDGPLTNSPTSGDLSYFPPQQGIAELDAATHAWLAPQDPDAEGPGILRSYSGDIQQPAEPEELVLSSPDFLDLLRGPDNHVELIDESPPGYATCEPTIDATDGVPSQFLNACRLYANSISDKSHSNIETVIDSAFEVTKRYYLEGADHLGRIPTKMMKRVWSEPPTIEAALTGMNCLLRFEAMPTLCELISLAFLSLALLGLSLDTHDLAVVVRILHFQAKSWSSLLTTKQERTWFADFIDDLWLLAEQDQSHARPQAVAGTYPFRADTPSLSLMESNDFVVQIAQIFINCQSMLQSRPLSI